MSGCAMTTVFTELSLSLVQLYMMSHERAASSDKTEIRCLLKSLSSLNMADQDEFRYFIGNLSWSTSERGLNQAFEKFGHLVDAKVWKSGFFAFLDVDF
ncbi:hypothetical protein ACS0TY_028899 [Phlomoides rotata]